MTEFTQIEAPTTTPLTIKVNGADKRETECTGIYLSPGKAQITFSEKTLLARSFGVHVDDEVEITEPDDGGLCALIRVQPRSPACRYQSNLGIWNGGEEDQDFVGPVTGMIVRYASIVGTRNMEDGGVCVTLLHEKPLAFPCIPGILTVAFTPHDGYPAPIEGETRD